MELSQPVAVRTRIIGRMGCALVHDVKQPDRKMGRSLHERSSRGHVILPHCEFNIKSDMHLLFFQATTIRRRSDASSWPTQTFRGALRGRRPIDCDLAAPA